MTKSNPFIDRMQTIAKDMNKQEFLEEMSEVRHRMFLEWEMTVLNRAERRARTKAQRLASAHVFDAGFASCANFLGSIIYSEKKEEPKAGPQDVDANGGQV